MAKDKLASEETERSDDKGGVHIRYMYLQTLLSVASKGL